MLVVFEIKRRVNINPFMKINAKVYGRLKMNNIIKLENIFYILTS